MASNLTKVPLIRVATGRSYAQLAPVSGKINYDIKTSTLPNKVVVTSADNESPLSRVSILFKAGSRNEAQDNAGATHILRIAAGLSTKNASQFAIMRQIQQVGANLTCTADRECIAYTLEGTRAAVESVMPFLTEVATQQTFKPWEVSDSLPRVRLELATRPPQQRAVDLLHKAAYRRGLGNSIYIAKHQIGKISSETLQHYTASNFLGGRAAVAGLGVNHSQLEQYATSLQLESGDGTNEATVYKGGEIRSDKGGDMAFIAIAGQGANTTNMKESIAFAVLQKALGNGPSVKWGTESSGVLSKAAGTGNFAIQALNVSYTDSGLFGALVAAEARDAGRLVETAVKMLKGANVTDADVNRAKNQLKLRILSDRESGTRVVHYMGTSAVLTGNVASTDQIIGAIDQISTSDVQAAAKKVASSKLSIAAVGNLRTVPFLDELK